MKTLKVVTLFLLLFSANSVFAAAEVNEEYNFQQDIGNIQLHQRKSSHHTFLDYGYKTPFFGGLTIAYRNHTRGNDNEQRLILTQPLWSNGNFKIGTKWDYRTFDTKETHWRGRLIFDYKHPLTENIDAWIKIQPRISFKDNKDVFDSRDQIGLTFKYKNLTVSPFIDRVSYETIENHKETIVGTKIRIKL